MVIVSDTRTTEQDMLEASIEIISVGNELLSGTIANTNAQWISAQITKAGGTVKRITTLGDWDKEISSAIKDSIQRGPDWLILTGGLGPTYDDNTLRGLSSALGQRLKLDTRAVEMLRRSYARHKQRLEMKAVFSGVILPQIKEKVGKHHAVESMFETIGVSESMLAPTLSRLVVSHPSDELYLKTHPKGYSYVMKISNNRRIRSKPKPKLNIQIVSKGKERSQVEARYRTILDTLKVEIRRLGGKMYSPNDRYVAIN